MDLKLGPEVVFDSSMSTKKSCSRASAKEWRNFMSSNPSDMFKSIQTRRVTEQVCPHEEKEVFDRIFKEVEELGVSQMPWKERKAMENQKVLALGGKPLKNIKTPIFLGKCIRKKQERMKEEAIKNEAILLGRPAKRAKKTEDLRKREDRGLMASEGYFKQGILHVKPMAKNVEERDGSVYRMSKTKKKSKSKKHKGKKKR
jgi:hypothetical protein